MTKKLRKRHCPHCNHQLDAATAISGEDIKPRKGDLTICIECAVILQFDKNIRPVRLTGMTLDALPAEVFDQVTKVRNQLIQMKREYHGNT